MLDRSEYEKLLRVLDALLQEEKRGNRKELGTLLHWKRMVSRPERVSQLSKRGYSIRSANRLVEGRRLRLWSGHLEALRVLLIAQLVSDRGLFIPW